MNISQLPDKKEELEILKLKSEVIKLQADIEKSKKEFELLQFPFNDSIKKWTVGITLVTAIGTIGALGLSYYTATKLYDVRAKELEIKAIKYDIQMTKMKRLRPKLEDLKNTNLDETINPAYRHKIAEDAIILLDTIINEIR
jgi:hypothetical protein